MNIDAGGSISRPFISLLARSTKACRWVANHPAPIVLCPWCVCTTSLVAVSMAPLRNSCRYERSRSSDPLELDVSNPSRLNLELWAYEWSGAMSSCWFEARARSTSTAPASAR